MAMHYTCDVCGAAVTRGRPDCHTVPMDGGGGHDLLMFIETGTRYAIDASGGTRLRGDICLKCLRKALCLAFGLREENDERARVRGMAEHMAEYGGDDE